MRILAVSDTHGAASYLIELVKSFPADAVLHMGDGERDVEALRRAFPQKQIYAVRGNCDFGTTHLPETLNIELGGIKVFMTHGHSFGVKYTLDEFAAAARAHGADVALYGHTHIQDRRFLGDMWVLNPGSLLMNSPGKLKFGYIDIDAGRPVCFVTEADFKRK